MALAVAISALGVSVALMLDDPTPGSRIEPFDEIAQTASAESSGVRIAVLGASFSGTETLLRAKLSVLDESNVLAAVGRSGQVERVFPSGPGFSGSFETGTITATMNRFGELVLHLPPLRLPPGYNGSVEFHLTQLTVMLDAGPATLEGAWSFALLGPGPSEVSGRLAVEHFGDQKLAVSGGEADITGLRSRSETQVTVTLPAGTTMLTAPNLRVDDDRLAATGFRAEGPVVTAWFPATPFGSKMTLSLGTLTRADPAGATVLVVSLAGAPRDPTEEATAFSFTRGDVISGDADLVVGAEAGRYSGRPWVGLVIAGNLHPENGKPRIFDGRGEELALAHVQVGYQKDANGSVHEGSTNIGFFVDDGADLTRVTFYLGPASAIESGAYSVELAPVTK